MLSKKVYLFREASNGEFSTQSGTIQYHFSAYFYKKHLSKKVYLFRKVL